MMRKFGVILSILLALAAYVSAAPGPEGSVIPSSSITATAHNSAHRSVDRCVNGSGLTDWEHNNGSQDFWWSNWVSDGTARYSDDTAAGVAWVKLDFDKHYDLTEMWVWNLNVTYDGGSYGGFKDCVIQYSNDGMTWQTLGGTDATHVFNRAPETDGYVHNTEIDFGGVDANSVIITAKSTWGMEPDTPTGRYPGLAELVFVTSTNIEPAVNAGANLLVELGQAAELDGTVTDDGQPVGAALTTEWTVVSGPGSVTFADASAVDTTATFDAAGTYVLRLTASDTEFTVYDEAAVTVMAEGLTFVPADMITVSAHNQAYRSVQNIINGSGLDEALLHTNESGYPGNLYTWWSNWVADGSAKAIDETESGVAWVRFDFPESIQIDQLWVWNLNVTYDGGSYGGLKDVAIQYTSDGTNWTTLGGEGTTHVFNRATELPDYAHNTEIDFGGIDANSIVITAKSTWGMEPDTPTGQYPGLAEVRFVSNGNFPPTVDAGDNQANWMPDSSFTLAGTADDDGMPYGSTLTTIWTEVSATGNVTFDDASRLDAVATFSAPGTYELKLTADDGQFTAEDTMVVVLYEAGYTGLAGQWKFDETAGAVAADSSGRGIDGTVKGDPNWVEGKFDGAIQLSIDGDSKDHVVLGSAEDFDFNNDFSVSIWIKTTGWEKDAAIISNKDWNSGGNVGWAICGQGGGSGNWQWNMGDGSGRIDYDPGNQIISDGNWHHIAMTCDRDGQVRLFFDGSVRASGDISWLTNLNSGMPVVVGTDGTEGTVFEAWYDGLVDDVRIYERVLSDREVAILGARYPKCDMDSDYKVDEKDLAEFAAEYLTAGPDCDYDGDSDVDLADFSTFAEQWLTDWTFELSHL